MRCITWSWRQWTWWWWWLMTAQWWHQPGQRWQVLTRSRCAENPSFPFKGSYKMQWKLSWGVTLYHFVFQVCHFYTTSKKADAEKETVSFISKETTPDVDIQVPSATHLVVWWPSLSSPYRRCHDVPMECISCPVLSPAINRSKSWFDESRWR